MKLAKRTRAEVESVDFMLKMRWAMMSTDVVVKAVVDRGWTRK